MYPRKINLVLELDKKKFTKNLEDYCQGSKRSGFLDCFNLLKTGELHESQIVNAIHCLGRLKGWVTEEEKTDLFELLGKFLAHQNIDIRSVSAFYLTHLAMMDGLMVQSKSLREMAKPLLSTALSKGLDVKKVDFIETTMNAWRQSDEGEK